MGMVDCFVVHMGGEVGLGNWKGVIKSVQAMIRYVHYLLEENINTSLKNRKLSYAEALAKVPTLWNKETD